MRPSAIRQHRLKLLQRRLEWLGTALEPQGQNYGPAGIRLAETCRSHRDRIDQDLETSDATPLSWDLSDGREKDCGQHFTEALALLNGRDVFARCGPTRLAKALLQELATGCNLAEPPTLTPDAQDSYSGLSTMIRMRFPPGDLWDVPVVAHEFGHFLTAEGPARPQAYADYLTERLAQTPVDLRERETAWCNEYFADVFATYALGPAFACSALLLRFKVVGADNDNDPTHPSYIARAAVIFETLRRMGFESPALAKPLNHLTRDWAALLQSAGIAETRPDIGDRAQRLLVIVRGIAPNAAYRGWPDDAREAQEALLSTPGVKPRRIALTDMLNGAWLAVTNHADPALISDRAIETWQRING